MSCLVLLTTFLCVHTFWATIVKSSDFFCCLSVSPCAALRSYYSRRLLFVMLLVFYFENVYQVTIQSSMPILKLLSKLRCW